MKKKQVRKIGIVAVKGGPGSGHYGHTGLPGKWGGSRPRGEDDGVDVSKLKTSWSLGYLNGKFSGRELHKWRVSKAEEYKEMTGVPWSHYHSSGKIRFVPHVDFKDVDPIRDDVLRSKVMDAIDKAATPEVGLIEISVGTELDLQTVSAVVAGLTKDGKLRPVVNRMGEASWFTAA